MKPLLYHSDTPVILVGGGPVGAAQLKAALQISPFAIAVDSGLRQSLPDGLHFQAAIGDFDSALPHEIEAFEKSGGDVWRIAEQETTDFEKSLRSIRAPFMLGVGFLGGRVDHQLAAMNAMVKFPDQRVVLLGEEDICFHCPETLELDLETGTRVSLFPMRPVRGLESKGLKWPVNGLELTPDGQIGTSNEATGGRVRVSFDGLGTLVVLPHSVLRQVVEAIDA